MRLFIALDISEECKDYLNSVINKIKKEYPDLSFATKDKLHLTLKFLGDVSDNNQQVIVKKLKKIKFKQFEASLSGFGVFPNENYFRVLWVGLYPEKPFFDLQKQIDNSLKDLFDKEKNFQPHVTLARIKFIENKKKFINFIKTIKIKPISLELKEFKLVKSTLQKRRSVYETVEIFPNS